MKALAKKMKVSLSQKNKPRFRIQPYKIKIVKIRRLKRSLNKKNQTLTKHKNKPKFNKRLPNQFNKNKN